VCYGCLRHCNKSTFSFQKSYDGTSLYDGVLCTIEIYIYGCEIAALVDVVAVVLIVVAVVVVLAVGVHSCS
jgi:hypothetical protein